MKTHLRSILTASAILVPSLALGQPSNPTVQTQILTEPSSSGNGGWTPEMMRAAKPRMPTVSPEVGSNAARATAAPTASGPAQASPGRPPELTPADRSKGPRIAPELSELKDNAQPALLEADAASVEPEAQQFAGFPYTTQRVTPADARVTYPFSTVGKLFFTEQGVGNFVCSAEVLQARIVQTAGHCVAAPNPNPNLAHFFTNWIFVPGYDNGSAPFGVWRPTAVSTTAAWYFSNGSVPNSGDIGQFVMADQNIFGGVHRIAELTGFLGWRTNGILGNHVTQLGYPVNLDSGERAQRTDAGNVVANTANTAVIGSAQSGGTSGGPWVQDWGIAPVSNPALPLGNNFLIGSTSYGPSGTSGFLGASILGQDFLTMLHVMCNLNPGNCTVSP